MKKASFIALLIVLTHSHFTLAYAGSAQTEIHYSNELKRRLVNLLENDETYRKQYFESAMTLQNAENMVTSSLKDLKTKIENIEHKMKVAHGDEYTELFKQRREYLSHQAQAIKYWEETLKPSRRKMPPPEQLALSKARQHEWQAFQKKNN